MADGKAITMKSDGFSQIGSEGSWFGVTVTAGHINAIDLNSNYLSGNIPMELGNIGQLIKLSLGNNDLSNVPPELGNLSNLIILILGYNKNLGLLFPGDWQSIQIRRTLAG